MGKFYSTILQALKMRPKVLIAYPGMRIYEQQGAMAFHVVSRKKRWAEQGAAPPIS